MSDAFEQVAVYTWRLGNRTEIRASTVRDGAARSVELRIYENGSDADIATRKGVRVPVEHLPHLRRAIEALERAAGEGRAP